MGRKKYSKRVSVDSKGRVALPSLRVFPKVKQVLDEKAERVGLSPAYYILRLIAIDTGYLKASSPPEEIKKWLRTEPDLIYIAPRSVAGKTLARVWRGADVTTKEIAAASSLSYQQAYRQLQRDPGVHKTDLGWTFRSLAEG